MMKGAMTAVVAILLGLVTILSPSVGTAGEAERVYTVVKGDTLWDISDTFYGDPFLWPLLWQQNQHITNPHLIYPGDKIRLYPYEVLLEEEEEKITPERAGKEQKPSIKLYRYPEVLFAGFVDPSPPKGVGEVIKGEGDKEHFLQGDLVYLSFGEGVEPVEGEDFTLFRVGQEVRHPETGKVVGKMVYIVGRVVLVDRQGEVYRGRILLSYEGVRKGDRLLPYLPPLQELPLLKGDTPVAACLVASRRPGTMLGEGDVVYLDKGEEDGLKPGLVMEVVRSGGQSRSSEGEIISLPKRGVGRLAVISTRKGTATALILCSREPIEVGDRAEVLIR